MHARCRRCPGRTRRSPIAPLPVSGDDGFPQAFLLELGGTVYRLTLGVAFTDPAHRPRPAVRRRASSTCPIPISGLFLEPAGRARGPAGRRRGCSASRRVVLDIPIAARARCASASRASASRRPTCPARVRSARKSWRKWRWPMVSLLGRRFRLPHHLQVTFETVAAAAVRQVRPRRRCRCRPSCRSRAPSSRPTSPSTMPQAGMAQHFHAEHLRAGQRHLTTCSSRCKTLVHISLGYADGDRAEVMTGLLHRKVSLQAGDGFYQATQGRRLCLRPAAERREELISH